jgi:hypothetical protein
MPVRLRDDADTKPLRFKQPADDRHAERGMIDIGSAGHQYDVAGVPAERCHLGMAHGQEWRRLARLRHGWSPGHQWLFSDRNVAHGVTHKTPDLRIQRLTLLIGQ